MNKIQLLSVILIAFLFTGGCTNSKEGWGAVGGGVLGAAAGFLTGDSTEEKITGALVGGAAGAITGGMIGSYLDQQDQEKVEQAIESTPDNQTATWTNPSTGNKFQVTPVATFTSTNQQPCRMIKTEVYTPDGKRKADKQKVCRNNKGTWVAQK